jgi:hypothetical protein
MLRHKIEVLEESVLTDDFWATLPSNEFELGDPLIGFQIECPAGVARAKRGVFDHFARLKEMRKTQKYSESVNDYVYLTGEALN